MKEELKNKKYQTATEETQTYRRNYLNIIQDIKKEEYKQQRIQNTKLFTEKPTIDGIETLMSNSMQLDRNATWQLINKAKQKEPLK